ncbi:ATP synthase subunit I [Vibrio ruber]|uniref:F0F1 ATP synthase subunit I n=1 Tax=Vibrio ruber (strain DSM 16370 / JCM 11486 / BCRC 17186 / CECT 7878 / LMG 23124 / VR1) TaxID=1123498 RepID=A0A1R4LIU6_VIBR1|nr:ATP synthase subunit I [Vibrio ruber]WNJ96678.1 ATP synthase subunit I [Vibrio ruber]SJN56512.1 F0F1 ATP synthase subunit I [Vibrio ruber DSM 16370]
MLNKWFILSFSWQLAFFIVLATIVGYVLDEKSGLSAFLGGLTYIVPSLLANLYMHKRLDREDNAGLDVGRAYVGNLYKLMMTAGVLVFIFREIDINAGALIVSYCLASVVQFVTSFFSINRE